MSNTSVILKTFRKSKGMTQQEVADAAGIHMRHYQMFENGKRDLNNASFRIACAVYKALGIALVIVIDEKDKENMVKALAIQESETKHLHMPFADRGSPPQIAVCGSPSWRL